ncbi:MAG: hypothetical protein FWC59_00080 [Actinomycetia bacterium]|nr:hypothetical protein [Actinomycetes bacterium]
MADFYNWMIASPYGVLVLILALMVLFTLFALFYEFRTHRLFPDRAKRRRGHKPADDELDDNDLDEDDSED